MSLIQKSACLWAFEGPGGQTPVLKVEILGSSKKTILVIDDNKTNIDIVVEILKESFDIMVALDGKSGIKILEENHVDLILLDIMMPELDGFETCKLIKDNQDLKDIPVIFLTARSDEESINSAYEAGGVDYITKPVKIKELMVKVRTQIQLRETADILKRKNKILKEQIEKEIELRKSLEIEQEQKETFYLKQLDKSSFGDLIGIIVHQLKQPLNSINLGIGVVEDDLICGTMTRESLEDNLNKIIKKISFMTTSIDNLRSFFSPYRKSKEFSLKEAIYGVIFLLELQMRELKIQLDMDIKDDININGYENDFQQVVMNILNNAKEVLTEKNIKDPAIKITLEKNNDLFLISLSDNGGGIEEKIREKIFDKYFTTKGEEGTGIGLYLSKKIIEENFAGTLNVKNTEEGAVFTIEIPV